MTRNTADAKKLLAQARKLQNAIDERLMLECDKLNGYANDEVDNLRHAMLRMEDVISALELLPDASVANE